MPSQVLAPALTPGLAPALAPENAVLVMLAAEGVFYQRVTVHGFAFKVGIG